MIIQIYTKLCHFPTEKLQSNLRFNFVLKTSFGKVNRQPSKHLIFNIQPSMVAAIETLGCNKEHSNTFQKQVYDAIKKRISATVVL